MLTERQTNGQIKAYDKGHIDLYVFFVSRNMASKFDSQEFGLFKPTYV